MKKYLVFLFDCYYPKGGMNDLIGQFDDEQAAIDFAKMMRGDDTLKACHVVNTENNEAIFEIDFYE